MVLNALVQNPFGINPLLRIIRRTILCYQYYDVKYIVFISLLCERLYLMNQHVLCMPLRSIGTFRLETRSKSGRIHIPAQIVRDSQFPLEEGEVVIEIKDGNLLISPTNKMSNPTGLSS
jgi:hypothetical protein